MSSVSSGSDCLDAFCNLYASGQFSYKRDYPILTGLLNDQTTNECEIKTKLTQAIFRHCQIRYNPEPTPTILRILTFIHVIQKKFCIIPEIRNQITFKIIDLTLVDEWWAVLLAQPCIGNIFQQIVYVKEIQHQRGTTDELYNRKKKSISEQILDDINFGLIDDPDFDPLVSQ